MALERVVIYGGKGALGTKCVSYFKEKIVTSTDSLPEQEHKVLTTVSKALDSLTLDAIICVAGGWTGGNVHKDFAKNADLMWRQSVWSSVIAATIAAKHLKEGGLLILTGANAALHETPSMIGYGMAKAAVHHLLKSLACQGSGMPTDSNCVAVLPITLDTPMNRKWMPTADFTTWTSIDFLAELFWEWCTAKECPANGSLVQLLTTNSKRSLLCFKILLPI